MTLDFQTLAIRIIGIALASAGTALLKKGTYHRSGMALLLVGLGMYAWSHG
jgi:hypothetical protein